MSKIEKELLAATKLTAKRGEDRQDYLKRLMMAVQDLKDPEWDALSEAAQDWNNDAATACQKKNDISDFPDAEKEEPPARQRRKADDDEPATVAYKAKKGDEITATTKRGKTYTGKVVEVDGDVVVIECDGKELEIDATTSTIEPGKGEQDPAEPKVGDTVEIKTKRGKVVMGNVVEIDDKVVVIKDTSGAEQEFDIDRCESITVRVEQKGEVAPSGRRRAAADDKKEEPAKEPGGRATRARNGGVSVSQRIMELIAENLDITEAEIEKVLKKEEIEFRDNTLSLNFAATHKVVEALKKAGKLKK